MKLFQTHVIRSGSIEVATRKFWHREMWFLSLLNLSFGWERSLAPYTHGSSASICSMGPWGFYADIDIRGRQVHVGARFGRLVESENEQEKNLGAVDP